MSLMPGVRRDWNRFVGRTRGKCRWGPNEQSVRKVGDFWLGESTNDYACHLAPSQVCPRCEGRGLIPPTPEEVAMAGANTAPADRQCETCTGTGQVPGPHWPWRHDHPGALPLELLS